jgi:hypothetical protein
LRIVQQTSQVAPRALLALLLLTASLALPPCTMAQGDPAEEHHCPHCPPADNDHGVPDDAVVEPACDALDQLNHDGRTAHDVLKDIPVAVLPWSRPRGPDIDRGLASRPLLHTHHPGEPPLHLLNCVNLN